MKECIDYVIYPKNKHAVVDVIVRQWCRVIVLRHKDKVISPIWYCWKNQNTSAVFDNDAALTLTGVADVATRTSGEYAKYYYANKLKKTVSNIL